VLEGGSPYDWTTYRYTPLMAYLVIPNHLIHPLCGKLLFASLDIICALLIRSILRIQGKVGNVMVDLVSLLNPLTIVLSTRGSSDIIILFLVLLTVRLLLSHWIILAGLVYGLSVHFKIYPIIYSIPLCLFIDWEY